MICPLLSIVCRPLTTCRYEQREGGKYDNKDVNVGYIPSGMSVHEWHGLKTAEKRKQQAKNFAAFGPTSFKSRSLQGKFSFVCGFRRDHFFDALRYL